MGWIAKSASAVIAKISQPAASPYETPNSRCISGAHEGNARAQLVEQRDRDQESRQPHHDSLSQCVIASRPVSSLPRINVWMSCVPS
jgi:hypothetical protein